jgi:flagellar basal-body rod protein FlgB
MVCSAPTALWSYDVKSLAKRRSTAAPSCTRTKNLGRSGQTSVACGLLLLVFAMSDLLSVSPYHRALDYHAERHNILSSNVANTNTPGFRPKELLRVEDNDFHNLLPMVRTEHEHYLGSGLVAQHDLTVDGDDWNTAGLDNNNVSLEREMSKLQANDLRYQGVSRLVTRNLAMLRYASNDGSGA